MKTILVLLLTCSLLACSKNMSTSNKATTTNSQIKDSLQILADTSFGAKLTKAACSIIDPTILYDPAYTKIAYPNGDVAANRGVCTDVVIRAYRLLGIDLQQLVHEDMKASFDAYPSKRTWGLTTTDRNIDHRRVPNLQTFFGRHGTVLPNSKNPSDYQAGDIVAWKLPNGLLHIGIVIDKQNSKGIPLVVHNIGRGQIAEDVLLEWEIIGHYRYGEK